MTWAVPTPVVEREVQTLICEIEKAFHEGYYALRHLGYVLVGHEAAVLDT